MLQSINQSVSSGHYFDGVLGFFFSPILGWFFPGMPAAADSPSLLISSTFKHWWNDYRFLSQVDITLMVFCVCVFAFFSQILGGGNPAMPAAADSPSLLIS